MHLNLSQSSVDTTEPWVIVIGLLGMIISVLANIESAEEMYPLFLSRRLAEQASKRTTDKTGSVFSHIPSSVKMAFVSDACISVYGVYHQDILVGLYGALNSLVILFTIFSIFEEAQRERPGSAAPDVWVQGMHVAAYC
jgi:hypothetical protein